LAGEAVAKAASETVQTDSTHEAIEEGGIMKTPARRKRQDTPVLERLVSKITVIDSDHALFGLSLRLISLCAAKGRSHQIVELPDGRHLTLRRPSSGLAQWYRSRAGGAKRAPGKLMFVALARNC
jgi:hypothetical protein